jgi:hypothetical protein
MYNSVLLMGLRPPVKREVERLILPDQPLPEKGPFPD